jgi:shikimate dehydrogenase
MGEKKIARAGLIGAGIQASRSPFMHRTEARALGLDLSYELFDLDQIEGGAEALPRILDEVRAAGFLGVNITYPVKQAVLPLLDGFSDDVRALGACNTVVFHKRRSIGHNTDWFGFAENFRRGLKGADLTRVVQLGAGGAGSAVTFALIKLGARRIAIHDLDADRAAAAVQRFAAVAGEAELVVCRDLEQEIAAADGVVNCTPVGMAKHPGLPLSADLLHPELWVADIVYVPLVTDLLRAAKARGCRILAGGGMAVFQAAEALALFTGKVPDAERMLAAFEKNA